MVDAGSHSPSAPLARFDAAEPQPKYTKNIIAKNSPRKPRTSWSLSGIPGRSVPSSAEPIVLARLGYRLAALSTTSQKLRFMLLRPLEQMAHMY